MKICAFPGCERKAVSRGHCDKHYRRILKRGSASDYGSRIILEGSAIEKFHLKYKIDQKTGCWIWTGSTRPNAKGVLYPRHTDDKGKSVSAHRFSHQHYKGDVKGKFVCHKCDTPLCVNPDHLVAENHAWNMEDMRKKGRSYKGSGENANRSVLTDEQARNIKESVLPQSKLAAMYGVSQKTISRIKRGETYVHA
jgi:hypothetical protein